MANFLVSAWRFDALLWLGFVGAIVAYAAAVRRRWSGSAVFFGAGMLLLLLAVVSPLDALAGSYLLSAHMVQHLIVAQIAPPLLLLSLPAALVERALAQPVVARVEGALRRPAVAWAIGIGMLWVWHVPALYELTTSDATIRLLQNMLVLLAGLIFYWPIFAPVQRSRMSALQGVLYLASACLVTAVLGMMFTFSSSVVYSVYLDPADPYGILHFVRDVCGLTPEVDQQIGGLLMWVPCCFLYLGAIIVVLARWYATPEKDTANEGVLESRL
jgi:putative membrane protein